MKNKRYILTAVLLIAAAAIVGMTALAVSNYGTKDDPLVTLSYLTEILTPDLLDKAGAEIDKSVRELSSAIEDLPDSGAEFKLVTLDDGDTLECVTGTELVLRSGDVLCAGELLNITSGESADEGGALIANNLYVAVGNSEVTAVSETVTLLVRGTYTIG